MNKKNRNLTKKIRNNFWMKDWIRDALSDDFSPWDRDWENDYFNSELQEDEDNFYLKAELPGIDKDKIKIELKNNQLRIKAEKEEEKEVNNKKYHFSEISYGSFLRNFSLPNAVNSQNIKANYENGILIVTIPKSAESKVRQIRIE